MTPTPATAISSCSTGKTQIDVYARGGDDAQNQDEATKVAAALTRNRFSGGQNGRRNPPSKLGMFGSAGIGGGGGSAGMGGSAGSWGGGAMGNAGSCGGGAISNAGSSGNDGACTAEEPDLLPGSPVERTPGPVCRSASAVRPESVPARADRISAAQASE